PGRVSHALRRRGIGRDDAEAVSRWLSSLDRHRWGRAVEPPPDDPVVGRVVATLRHRRRGPKVAPLLVLALGALPLHAQWNEALTRFADGDAIGAVRLFEQVARDNPAAPAAWFNIGAARWDAGDEVGSVAAWLQGSRVGPRDRRFDEALDQVASLPRELR